MELETESFINLRFEIYEIEKKSRQIQFRNYPEIINAIKVLKILDRDFLHANIQQEI
jgi:hypothetical protein